MNDTNIDIFADIIERKLGASVAALSGANIAPEVARDKFSETTIGYRKKEEGEMWKRLFGASASQYWKSHASHVGMLPRDEKLIGRHAEVPRFSGLGRTCLLD